MTELFIIYFCPLLWKSSASRDQNFCDDTEIFFIHGVIRRNFKTDVD